MNAIHGFDNFCRQFGRLLSVFAYISGVCCFLMMMLVTINTVGRYLFNVQVIGTFEYTEAILVLILFFAFPIAQYHGTHIHVSFLMKSFSAMVRRFVQVVTLLLSAALFSVVSYAAWTFAMDSWDIRELANGAVRFPIYPFKFAIFIGLALLTIQFLLDAGRAAVGLRVPQMEMPSDDEDEPVETH
ncbi:MAG: TRAP transporter small permease [Castellaniella sp.]